MIIKNEDGITIIDFPLTPGVVGALLTLQMIAIGTIAAPLTNEPIQPAHLAEALQYRPTMMEPR